MNITQSGESITQRPTFTEGQFECRNFVCCLLEMAYSIPEQVFIGIRSIFVPLFGIVCFRDVYGRQNVPILRMSFPNPV